MRSGPTELHEGTGGERNCTDTRPRSKRAGKRKKWGTKNRPRGTKKRGDPEQAFISMNTSGRPQLLDNLDKLGLRKTRTIAVLNQEHQARG